MHLFRRARSYQVAGSRVRRRFAKADLSVVIRDGVDYSGACSEDNFQMERICPITRIALCPGNLGQIYFPRTISVHAGSGAGIWPGCVFWMVFLLGRQACTPTGGRLRRQPSATVTARDAPHPLRFPLLKEKGGARPFGHTSADRPTVPPSGQRYPPTQFWDQRPHQPRRAPVAA